ncbi:hypothetical protein MKW94_016297, partial [Papaver nudicaule]|nr:hypothetical protein [Papaver nudicaule]
NSGIKISGVTYLNVHGTSSSPIAVSLRCSPTTPCEGIKLYNVKLSYSKKPAKSFCFSAAGTSRGQVLPGIFTLLSFHQKMANLIVLFALQFVFLFIFVAFPISTNAATYNVLKYGAKPNGRTDSTRPFLRAWSAACKSKKPATMWIPRGTYLVKTIVFGGPCRSKIVTVQIDGKIQAPPGKNYWIIGKSRNWILFHGINGLTINGGILDGRGSNFWNCRRSGANCPEGAISLTLQDVRNGIISGLKS